MRYKKAIIPTILAIAIVVTGAWGYNQYRMRNYYEDQLINQYQRIFYDMKDNVETVQTSLSKSLVSASEESDILLLSQIYQQSYFAHDKLSQLPIGHENLAKTEKFLNQVGDYSYSLIGRYIRGDKLDDKERQTLFKLQDYTSQLTTELQAAHDEILTGDLTMFKIREGGKEKIGEANENILDVQMQKYEEEQMTDYPELIYDGPFSDQVMNVEPKGLGEGTVDEKEAEKIALDFLGIKNPEEINMFNKGESTGSSNIDAYTFNITPEDGNGNIIIGVSVQGGNVVWMENPKEAGDKNISQKEALNIAKKFLDENGYSSMQANYSTKYDNSVLFNFVYEEDGIAMYTDLIKVKVSLDDGEITGVDAANFLKSNHKRELPEPKLTEEEAREYVRVGFDINNVRLAVIPDRGNNNLLCYEFSGTYKGSDFIVYINALDGRQEDILQIIKDENGTLMM